MRKERYIYVALICATALSAFGQITRPSAEQAPAVPGTGQHRVGALNESVDPATGTLSVRIDAGVPPARGITVPFAFGYDCNAAQHSPGGLELTENSGYMLRSIRILAEANRYRNSACWW